MGRNILGLLTENWGLKLVSLILAVGFWFYVVGEESIEITKTVTLEVTAPNEKLSVVKSSTSYLEVTFQSPRHLFSALSSANVKARHKVQADKAGDYSFNVQSADFTLPAPEIRVTKISPPYVTVTLDEMVVKKLPIKVELVGEPAFGYRVDEEAIDLDPNAVLVEGPKSVLEKTDTIKTESIQLVGRVRSFRRTVKVEQGLGLKVVGDGITEVQIPIFAEVAEKELKAVPVKALGRPNSERYIELKTDQVPVILKGPKAILDQLQDQDVMAYIEVYDLEEGIHEVPVKLVLPPDTILKGAPPAVSIEIKKMKA